MRSTNRVRFDQGKLQKLINDKFDGISTKLDAELGRSTGYISKLMSAVRRGVQDGIAYQDYILIQKLYDVDIKEEEPEQVKEEDSKVSEGNITSRDLYKVIYSATYDAIMMALSNSGIMKEENNAGTCN